VVSQCADQPQSHRVLVVAASGYLLVAMKSLSGGRTARHPIIGEKNANAMTQMPTAIRTRITNVTTEITAIRRMRRVRSISVVSLESAAREMPGGDLD
jgi:hypothetical protein